MKLFLDTKARRFVKSAASNVALQTLHLKRRDQVPLEIVFVANNAVVTAPPGTATTVALKSSFSDSNFLALAAPGTNTLDLYTEPVEAAFSSDPASIPALLEVRWSAPGESLRTATLQVELQNSVILGTEGAPTAIPDLKSTQAQAEAGTSNETWMTPLRAWDAIRAWATANFSWSNLSGKPTSFPPSSHTHSASQITDFSTAVVAAAPPTTNASLLTFGTLADARLSGPVTASLAKADTASQPGHGHSISDVANLATALAEKATITSVTTVSEALTAESQARATADSSLQTALDTKVSISDFQDADNFINGRVDQEILDRAAAITTEASTRAAGDASLSGGLNNLISVLSTESQTRAAGDSSLAGGLASEASTRAAAVSSLQTALDTKAPTTALTTETQARIAGDSLLGGRIDTLSAAVTSADTLLGDEIDTLASALSLETAARISGDQSLSGGLNDVITALAGKQAAGTYATLVDGLVPASQLPSYVDDVLEFANLAAFPATGETGKIYVTTTAPSKAYRWTGSTYLEISPSEVTSVNGQTGAVTLTPADIGAASSQDLAAEALARADVDEYKANSGLDQGGEVQKARELADNTDGRAVLRLDQGEVLLDAEYKDKLREAIGAAASDPDLGNGVALRATQLYDPAWGRIALKIQDTVVTFDGVEYAIAQTASENFRLAISAASTEHDHAITDITGLETALDSKQPSGSYATLENGKLATAQLPDIAIADFLGDVADQAEMLTKTGQKGDWVTRADDGKVYVITGENPAQVASWTALSYPAAPVSSVAGKTGAVSLLLEDLTNFSSLAASAYKLAPFSHEVTSASSLVLSSVSGRAQAWTITFRAAVAYDFFLPTTVTVMGQVMHGPQLGDILTATLLTSGESSVPWTATFKRPGGSLLLSVTSEDSELKKSNLRFVYDGTSWELDRATWHQHTYSELLDTPPDVASGYFDRSTDAASRPPTQGQAPHQVVLSNDTRLTNARRVAWGTAPSSPTAVPDGAQPGAMAYDGSYLYLLVPTPGFQSLRWARSPMTTTW
jgi:hypothetical protein